MCDFMEDKKCDVETVEFHDRIEVWKKGQLVEVIQKAENKKESQSKIE